MGILEKLGCRKRKVSEQDSDVEAIRGDSSSTNSSDPPKSATDSTHSELANGGSGSPGAGGGGGESDNESFEDEFNRNLAQEGMDDNFENSLDNFDEMWPSVNDVINDRKTPSSEERPMSKANGALTNGSAKVAGGVQEASHGKTAPEVLPGVEQNGSIASAGSKAVTAASGKKPGARNWSPPGVIE